MLLNSRLISALSFLSVSQRAFNWLAGLTQLLVMLTCSLIGDYAPIVGKYAGRYAGKLYRLYTNRNTQQFLSAIDYYSRQFVTSQLGTQYPSISYQISPAICLPADIEYQEPNQQLTRRELLAIAKELKLSGYSRMNTNELREAIATI